MRQPLGQLLPNGQLVEIPRGHEIIASQSQYITGLNTGLDVIQGEISRRSSTRHIVNQSPVTGDLWLIQAQLVSACAHSESSR